MPTTTMYHAARRTAETTQTEQSKDAAVNSRQHHVTRSRIPTEQEQLARQCEQTNTCSRTKGMYQRRNNGKVQQRNN